MERILVALAVIVLAVGYHLVTVSGLKADAVEAVTDAKRDARKTALEECARQHNAATELIQSNARVTQIVLSGMAATQLRNAELAKTEAERLADSFGRQLVKQREAKPLPTPCNITQERADLLNRATGAVP